MLKRLLLKILGKGGGPAAPEPDAGTDSPDHPDDDHDPIIVEDEVIEEDGERDTLEDDELLVDPAGGDAGPADEPARTSFLARLFRRKEKARHERSDPAAETVSLDKPEDRGAKRSGLGARLKALLPGKPAAGPEPDGESGADGLEEIRSAGDLDVEFDGQSTLEIGRKKFALGLNWEPDRDGESIKSQAEALSDDMTPLDLVANYRSGGQFGFASRESGLKQGIRAGATSVPQSKMGRNWIAAFRLAASTPPPMGDDAELKTTGFFWVAGMRNGQVYEDLVTRDEDEARAIFLENLEAPGWQRIAAPEAWELGGTEEVLVKDILASAIGVPLRPVYPLKTYLPRIIAATIGVVILLTGFLFYRHWAEQKRIEQREMQEQLAEQVRVSPEDYPYFDNPGISQMIRECAAKMDGMIVQIPTWSQDVVSCSYIGADQGAIAATSWNNSGGIVPWIRAAFPPGTPQPKIDAAGESASLSIPVELDIPETDLPEPWESDRIDRVLTRRLQTLKLDNVDVTPIVEEVSVTRQAQMTEAVYNRHQITVTTTSSLKEYVQLFSDFPALMPESIVYEIQSGTWRISMSIYHPPILPTGGQ